MDESLFGVIAKTIGYHFWKPESDKEAISCGRDCAREIITALREKAPLRDHYVEVVSRVV